MCLIDILNRVGRHKWLRPLGWLLHFLATRFSLAMLTRIAGRRMVSAFAGAPAILLSGFTMRQALRDAKVLYNAMKFSIDTLRLDTFCLMVDLSLEAEACGCQVQFSDHDLPVVISHPVKAAVDVERMGVPIPYRDGRMPLFLETLRKIKDNYTVIRVAAVIGPFTLATQLGGSEIYVETRKDPRKVRAILEYCLKVISAYAHALSESGADMLLIAEPAASQLSPPAYEQFSSSYTKRLTATIKKPWILHICGKSGHLIDKMCESGADALSVDDVDITAVAGGVPRKMVVIGNISPLELLRGTPEEILKKTTALLTSVKDKKEFLIAPGCDLAAGTPLENILAFVDAVKGIKDAGKAKAN